MLNAILKGADIGVFLVAGAKLEVLGIGDNGVAEAGIDGGVDVYTFNGHADLAGVDKAELSDLLGRGEGWSVGLFDGVIFDKGKRRRDG